MNAVEFLKTIKSTFPFTPTDSQDKALKAFASFFTSSESNEVLLLKGYAGTGKTTLVGTLVKSAGSMRYKTVLLAPTGRAAKVMAAYAGRTAYTIHKRIYFTHQEQIMSV